MQHSPFWSEARQASAVESEGVGAIRIGAALRRIRERMEVSLVSVARRAEISDAMLSRIERGERLSPHFTTVAKIALVLGVSLDEVAHEAGIAVAVHRRTTPKAAAAEIRRAEHLEAAMRYLDRARDRLAKANES